jgi:hypothetical protein
MTEKFIVKTPVVQLSWPYLRQPDTQFDSIGHYKCDFLMTPEQAEEFVSQCSVFTVKGKPAKPKSTRSDDMVKFRTKQKAQITYEKNGVSKTVDMAPSLYYIVDGKPEKYPDDAPSPYSGSTGKLEIEVTPYEGFGGGVTLRLRSVLLHDIVTPSSGSGSGWDDDDAEGSTVTEEGGTW